MKNRTAKKLLAIAPYSVSLITIAALVVLGSLRNPDSTSALPLLSTLNQSSFTVSTDVFSESFVVARLSSSFSLPSAAANGEDFVSILVAYRLGQLASSPVLEKPNIIDTSNLNRDVIAHTVAEGENLQIIADRFGVSTTDIRWSNNMKNDTLSVGRVLYIPPRPGILYTVRAGDTIEGLAEKYQSNAEEIKTYNDLETTGLVVGQTIVLPSGILPITERPEYVPPTPRPLPINPVSSRTRQNLRIVGNDLRSGDCPGNPGSFGQCTWYAWCWRYKYMGPEYRLPTGRIGNAGTWTSSYNPARIPSLFYIDNNPRYGDVVQTDTGSPGHVGVVVAVRPNESITIREMNYAGRNVVNEAEIPWSTARSYNYIHQRR